MKIMQLSQSDLNLRIATICSGIGAPEVAFSDCEFAFCAEIDSFASAVLKHHYPSVPNLGDIKNIDGFEWNGKVDLLIGGPPCQAFSMAGERKSLDDDRGQLTFEYVRLLDEISPPLAIYENVKGILSDKQNAWGKFLGRITGDGGELFPPKRRWGNAGMVVGNKRSVAWRTIDAQHFGLAQRRSRVYAVIVDFGNLGRLVGAPSGFDTGRLAQIAGEIVFELGVPEWHPPARQAKGQKIRPTTGGSPEEFPPALSGTLGARVRNDLDGCGCYVPVSIETEFPPELVGTLGTGHGGRGCDIDGCGAYIPVAIGFNSDSFNGDSATEQRSPVLTCGGAASVAIGFSSVDYGNDAGNEIAPTLRSGNHVNSHMNASGNGVAVALRLHKRWKVRRLSVNECLRLQGFPDDYTDIAWGKGRSPQGRQYKAIGNSMAVPCLQYLRHCIESVLQNYREYFASAELSQIEKSAPQREFAGTFGTQLSLF